MTRTGLAMVALFALAACTSSDPSEPSDTVATGPSTTVAVTPTVTGAEEPDPVTVTDGGSAAPIESTSPVSESASPGIVPDGYTTVMVEITKADGTLCELCMWLADTGAERSRGLMGVTDLGAADGMAFVFEQPTSGSFFMFQTVTPLSIAWFAPDGELVSTTDMAPCESDDSGECERFAPGGEYQLAIEVFQGDLESIGITDGATARVLPTTESQTCPES